MSLGAPTCVKMMPLSPDFLVRAVARFGLIRMYPVSWFARCCSVILHPNVRVSMLSVSNVVCTICAGFLWRFCHSVGVARCW